MREDTAALLSPHPCTWRRISFYSNSPHSNLSFPSLLQSILFHIASSSISTIPTHLIRSHPISFHSTSLHSKSSNGILSNPISSHSYTISVIPTQLIKCHPIQPHCIPTQPTTILSYPIESVPILSNPIQYHLIPIPPHRILTHLIQFKLISS